MSARAKKRLTVYSITTFLVIAGFALYILMRESTPQENVGEGGNVEGSPSGVTLISKTKLEDESARNAYKREYIVEKVFERFDEETQETVQETAKTKIVEVGSDLNYFDRTKNKWKPSNPHFVDMGSYFELAESAYSVTIPKNLSGQLIYSIDGSPLRLQFRHIVISDGTNRIVLDVSGSASGSIDQNDSSVIKFSDVWNGIDVRYYAKKSQFQQDIIIKDKAILNSDAVNTGNAKIYFYTAMDMRDYADNGINIKIDGEIVDISSSDFRNTQPDEDNEIQFAKGEDTAPLHILGASPLMDCEGKETSKADRQLYKDAATGTLYFVESVDFAKIQDGVILDYNIVSGTISQDTIWTADITYNVSSDINLGAQLAIEPGTVIKFDADTAINVNSSGKIWAVGEPCRYIIFTSRTDDNSGEDLTETSTSGAEAYYDEAIYITSNASAASRISYCKIAYGTYGIRADKALSNPAKFENNILRECTTGIYLYNVSNGIRNNLIVSCSTYGIQCSTASTSTSFDVYNNTVDDCSTGMYFSLIKPGSSAIAKDNIFSNCTTGLQKATGYGTFTNEYNAFYGNTTDISGASKGTGSLDDTYNFTQPIYDSSVLGDYYINSTAGGGLLLQEAGSRYASTAGLDGEEFTWKAPTVAPTTINSSNNTPWTKVADNGYQSGDDVTIGYHHNRVDYVITANVTASDGDTDFTLTVEPGVITAMSGLYNLIAGNHCTFICKGDSDDIIVFTYYENASMDIEMPDYTYYGYGYVYLYYNCDADSQIQYTGFYGLGYGLRIDASLNTPISDCIARDCHYGFCVAIANALKNNLAYYNYFGIYTSISGEQCLYLQNNTFDSNTVGIGYITQSADKIVIKDNLFSLNGTGISKYGSSSASVAYNAYWGNEKNYLYSSTIQEIDDNSITLNNSPYDDAWETNWEWRKRWYVVQDSPLIDMGSQNAVTAGLSNYCTDYGGNVDCANVDIGYHCPGPLGVANIDLENQDSTNLKYNVFSFSSGVYVQIKFSFDASESWSLQISGPTGYSWSTSGSGQNNSINFYGTLNNESNGTLASEGTYSVSITRTGEDTIYFDIIMDRTAPSEPSIISPDNNTEGF